MSHSCRLRGVTSMVQMPVELFLGFIAVSVSMGIFGFIRNPQVPAMLVFAGMFILTMAVITDNVIMGYTEQYDRINSISTNFTPISQTTTQNRMVVALGGSVANLNANDCATGGEYCFTGELLKTNSILIGSEINEMKLYLKKVNSATGTATIGVWDSITDTTPSVANVNYIIDTLDVSTLTTSYELKTFTKSVLTNTYTLSVNEVVGILYTSGTTTNYIDVNFNNNVFDNTNSIGVRYDTASYKDLSAFDIAGEINLVTQSACNNCDNTATYTTTTVMSEPILFQFTELPKTLFGLLGVIFMLSGALMVMRTEV